MVDDHVEGDCPGDTDGADHIQFIGIEDDLCFLSLWGFSVVPKAMGAYAVLHFCDSFSRPAFRLKYFRGELGRSMVVILAAFFPSFGLAALSLVQERSRTDDFQISAFNSCQVFCHAVHTQHMVEAVRIPRGSKAVDGTHAH